MSRFPDTPVTLLTRLSSQLTGEDEENWARFFEIYQPAMIAFVRGRLADNGAFDAEDVVQAVLVKLVAVLRQGKYDRTKGGFRAYLAVMLRNTLFSFFRHERARPDSDATYLAELSADDTKLKLSPEVFARLEADGSSAVCVQSHLDAELDAKWMAACHRSAVEHVLTKTALKAEHKRVYRALEASEMTSEAVAKAFGMTAANVRQIKSRIDRMIAAYERQFS